MFGHERFRVLSSLAATGQLSADENLELRKHLLECEICREVHDDYAHLIQRQLPQADLGKWRRQVVGLGLPPGAEIRDRFFGRARAEGIEFSPVAERPSRPNHAYRFPNLRVQWWWRPLTAVCASAAVIIIAMWSVRQHQASRRPDMIEALTRQTLENESYALREQLQGLHRTLESQSAQLDAMRAENVVSKESLRKYEAELQRAQTQLSAEMETSDSERKAFNDAEKQRDTLIGDLRQRNDELGQQQADDLSDLVIQKQHLRDLTESLGQEAANLERERQLMAVTNDVRQLMGARNLHIMDVRDVNAQTGSAKAFGRVFYAEGQSLIFYAFDLPNSGANPAKYTFHAWAEKDLNSKTPRSLGTFEVDDHEQRRWILKVNDPGLLAGIESVFVTAESLRDAKEPRGKKLLYAFIAGQPNHP
jgi:hypothetical protein